MTKDPPAGTRRPGGREVRYLVVGGMNTVFGLALFAGLQLTLGRLVGPYAVLTFSQLVAVLFAYQTQRRLVWRSSAPVVPELARFASVYASTYLLNLGLLYLAVHGLGLPVIPSQFVITGLIVMVTYVVHRVWTFAYSEPAAAPRTWASPPA